MGKTKTKQSSGLKSNKSPAAKAVALKNNSAILQRKLLSKGLTERVALARAKTIQEVGQQIGMTPNSILSQFFSGNGKATKKEQETFSKFLKKVQEYSNANFSHMFPAVVRMGPNGRIVNAAMVHRLDKFKNTLRHLGTPSVHTASLGSVLETLAVGYAASLSGISVMYWEENRYFANSQPGARSNGPKPTFCGPGRERNDVMAVITTLNSNPTHKLLLLKTIINTEPLFRIENNNRRKEGWAKVFINGATPASVNQAVTALKTQNPTAHARLTPGSLTWNHIAQVYSYFFPKPSNVTSWKGFFEAEPDGIFFEIINGVLHIYVLEFKITKGKSELVPSEAWQLAKTKRLLEFYFGNFSPFSGDKLVVKTVFVPWQYGQAVNSTAYNFRDPWNVIASRGNTAGTNFSALYRTSLGNNYRPTVWTPPLFEQKTGINASVVQAVIEAYDRSSLVNVYKTTQMALRRSRVAHGRAAGGTNAVPGLEPNNPAVALKNRPAAVAAAAAARGVTRDCTNGRYGTNHVAIVIRCGVLTPEISREIFVNVQRLGLVHGWQKADDTVTDAQYQAGINAVNQICSWNAFEAPASSAFYNTRVDALRLMAFRDRLRAEGAGALPRGPNSQYLLPLMYVKPSDAPMYTILQRVLANANTLEPQNVNSILNALSSVQSNNINLYKRIFNKWLNRGNNRVTGPIAARTSSNAKLKRYVNNWRSRKTPTVMNNNTGQYGSFLNNNKMSNNNNGIKFLET